MKKKIVTSLALGVCSIGLLAGNAMALPYGNGPSLIETPPLASGQVALETITTNVFGAGVVDVYNDQSGVGAWTHAESDTTAYHVTYALGSGTSTPIPGILGIYDLYNNSKTWNLIDTSIITNLSSSFIINSTTGTLKVNGSLVDPTGWSGSFGYYFAQLGSTHYTEDDMHADGQNYVATYLLDNNTTWSTIPCLGSYGDSGTLLGNNDWLLAFEWNTWVDSDGDGIGDARDFNDGVFIVEDMNAVPEPASMLLFGAGLAGLAGIVTRRKQN